MGANCRGRIVVDNDQIRALLTKEAEAYRAWQEAKARELKAKRLADAKKGIKDQNRALYAADERVSQTVTEAASKAELVSNLQDAVDGATTFGGLAPGGIGTVSDAVSLANNGLRGSTQGILEFLPTRGGPSALDVSLDAAGNAGDVLGLGGDAAEEALSAFIRGGKLPASATRAFGVLGNTTNAAGAATYLGQVLERGSFYTPIAQFENIVNLPPSELRDIASKLDQGYGRGLSREIDQLLYGSDPEYLSSDLRDLANRKEYLDQELEAKRLAELDDPGVSVEDAEAETAERTRELEAARAELAKARQGLCVLPVSG